MICAVKGAGLLTDARGPKQGDVEAFAGLLVRLSRFAVDFALQPLPQETAHSVDPAKS
jgi:hypothetical protein